SPRFSRSCSPLPIRKVARRPVTRALADALATRGGPVTPIIALVEDTAAPLPEALSITMDDSTDRLVARLRSALRVRTLHAGVLRRSRSLNVTKGIPTCVPADTLDHATILCVARGGSYCALSHAIGERAGLIGALSTETAGRYLNTRDIDGVMIGEGLGARA